MINLPSMTVSGLLILLLSAPTLASQNYSYQCTNGSAERTIEVNYPEGTPVPCHVGYQKATSYQVLWSAENSQGYCESRANEFVERQRDWGWDCQRTKGDGIEASTESSNGQ